jgi:hypothetical protein
MGAQPAAEEGTAPTLETPAAAETPSTAGDEEVARETLLLFFTSLTEGDFEVGVSLYGGDY